MMRWNCLKILIFKYAEAERSPLFQFVIQDVL
jgi:hypothetical protein